MSHLSTPEVSGIENSRPVDTSQAGVTATLNQGAFGTCNDAYVALAQTPLQRIAAEYGEDWYHLHGQGD